MESEPCLEVGYIRVLFPETLLEGDDWFSVKIQIRIKERNWAKS
jgi:hypothetical protein